MVIGSKERVAIFAVAFFSIFALALAAGTLTTAVVLDGDGVPALPEEDPDRDIGEEPVGPGQLDLHGDVEGVTAADLTACVRPLTGGLGAVGFFGTVGLLFYGIYRRFSASVAVLSGYALSPFIFIIYFGLTACASEGGNGGDGIGDVSGVGETFGRELVSTPALSPLVIAAIFGVVFVGAIAILLRSSDDENVDIDEEDGEDEVSVDALARAAGEAADRLEDVNVTVDNEVYRAWYEMTQLLDVPSPETSTAGEFATAAVSIGLGREHVEELTSLFEEVRYGARDPEDREDRAIEIFRAIESEYSGADDGQSDDDRPEEGGGR